MLGGNRREDGYVVKMFGFVFNNNIWEEIGSGDCNVWIFEAIKAGFILEEEVGVVINVHVLAIRAWFGGTIGQMLALLTIGAIRK